MKPKCAKAKGRRAAKEIRSMIMAVFPELRPDDVVVASSGQTGEDLIFSPHARRLLPVSIECKNVEKINVWDAIAQAQSNCKEWMPVVMFRRNHSKVYGIIDGEELLRLLRLCWLYTPEEK